MRNTDLIYIIIIAALVVVYCVSKAYIEHQDEQIHDLCFGYFKQVNKTKDSDPKITEICSTKKFSIEEYSDVLDDIKE